MSSRADDVVGSPWSAMSPEIVSILALVAMFVIATLLPVNMGALAFVAAFAVGTLSLGMSTDDIIAGFPADLFLTLVGVTYLFAIAQNNGTVDLLVRMSVRAVAGRIALIPWVMFLITGVLTAIGALGPAAVAIIAPIALGFAARYRISALLMGMMVIHGAQAGGFSPISVYGVTVNGVVDKGGLDVSPTAVFLSSMLFNLAIGVVLFLVLGGRDLMRRRAHDPVHDVPASTSGTTPVGTASTGGSSVATATRTTSTTDTGTGAGSGRATPAQLATVVGLVVLAILALAFDLDVGFVAVTIAVVLALFSPQQQKGALSQVSWSTVMLIGGVLTYVAVLQEAGTVEYVGNGVAGLGVPLIAALLLCYIGGVVSAFASSTAILGVTIPLAVPFLLQGDVSATGLICAIAISSTIVDVSPFSTNGALVLANAQGLDRDAFYKRILAYSGLVVAVGPLLAWAVLVLPGIGR
jgi:Na+/H+ antiporter NhaD/arsenite permease-like protein